MPYKIIPLLHISLVLFFFRLTCTSVRSQIVPEATLGAERSVVKQNAGSIELIQGGATRGQNLFHSFEQFSVLTGHTAFFNNALQIQNIISRVTGTSISKIDGLLKANGTANLFLINPNGIIFGPNASLNIGGSFFASTASSLKFADGTQFSATAPQNAPLLTISVPIGLQFGNTPGRILVQGAGNNSLFYSLATPIIGAGASPTGLRVQPGKTLALVGGDIGLDGGTLTAAGGRIELGGVRSGTVSLNPTSSGWTLGYESMPAFANIQLSQLSAVDASGVGGSIQVQGAHITIADGSSILIQNQGAQSSGDISVNASESLELIGTAPQARILSSLFNETVGAGNGGDITISTKRLVLQGGGAISTKTFTTGTAGNVVVNASDSLTAVGFSTANGASVSGLGAYTFNKGDGGNISISTGHLSVLDGGTMISATFGPGRGGNTTVNAKVIEITGLNQNTSGPSSLQSSTFNTGNAGTLEINASQLFLNHGGQISSSTFTTGNAGSININASDFLDISNASGVISSAIKANDFLQQLLLFGIPPILSGSPGDVTINAGRLNLTNNGLISVSNQGLGNAGRIRANTVFSSLDNGSSIVAVTASGKGGNIQMQTTQRLQLNHNSSITASAISPEQNVTLLPVNPASVSNNSPISTNAGNIINGGNIILQAHDLRLRQGSTISSTAYGSGNGGNATFNTDILVALEKSSITASAFKGQGGNIRINTQGIFRSPDSAITASSQLGINGTVQINTLINNPTQGLAALSVKPVDVTGLIAQGCSGARGNVGKGKSEFIVTGRGGLPPQAGDPLSTEAVIVNKETLEAAGKNRLADETSTPPTPSTPAQIVEAQGWVINAKGEVVLTAYPTSTTHYNSSSSTSITCYAP